MAGRDCTHVHDELCGYVAAQDEIPCTYVCNENHDEADPVCTCAEACTAESFNEYCEVCGVDYSKCTGTDTAALYEGEYSVTVYTANNGTVTADRTTAAKGTTVTLTVTPDEGYEGRVNVTNLATGQIIAFSGNSKFTFTMPDAPVGVSASFVVCTHSGNTNMPADNADGTHSFTCSVCRAVVTSQHN